MADLSIEETDDDEYSNNNNSNINDDEFININDDVDEQYNNIDDDDDEYSGCIGDKALIEKVKARVDLLQKRLQQAQDQGTILEQRLIQYETLYGRAAPTQKALR